jgi:hypothetical protein
MGGGENGPSQLIWLRKKLNACFSFGVRFSLRHSTTIRTPRFSGFARLANFI